MICAYLYPFGIFSFTITRSFGYAFNFFAETLQLLISLSYSIQSIIKYIKPFLRCLPCPVVLIYYRFTLKNSVSYAPQDHWIYLSSDTIFERPALMRNGFYFHPACIHNYGHNHSMLHHRSFAPEFQCTQTQSRRYNECSDIPILCNLGTIWYLR